MTATDDAAPAQVWLREHECRLDQFAELVEQRTEERDYPWAERIERNVPIYGGDLCEWVADPGKRAEVQAELARALLDGPGIVVFRNAFDASVLDRAMRVFDTLIAEQHAAGGATGDHFAAPGANDRVWNALEKLAVRAPDVFADYYANDIAALTSVAWLGPNYQVTSAVNVVNPGGIAQTPHRDYHLGFMSADLASAYPAHVHRLGSTLTLQGAIAHCDMPVSSGPTLYLPYSQRYLAGYLAAHRADFRDYFEANHVQLPLSKGDAVFFNPALFHAAGHNDTAHVKRAANLLQVSSAFGKPMEAVNTARVCLALYPTLRRKVAAGLDDRSLHNIVTAAAESYPFPADLDSDRPLGQLAPESQAELLRRALREGWNETTVADSFGPQYRGGK